jgi:hypothetical protein
MLHEVASRQRGTASTKIAARGTQRPEREGEVPTVASKAKELLYVDTLVVVLLILILLAVTGHLHL